MSTFPLEITRSRIEQNKRSADFVELRSKLEFIRSETPAARVGPFLKNAAGFNSFAASRFIVVLYVQV